MKNRVLVAFIGFTNDILKKKQGLQKVKFWFNLYLTNFNLY